MPEQIRDKFLVSIVGSESPSEAIGVHYPASGQKFYKFTFNHWQVEQALTPCARSLYQWMLLHAPAGCALAVDLNDFLKETAIYRRAKRPYSMRQVRNALSELEEFELVSVRSEKLKFTARHVGPVQTVSARRSGGKKLQKVEENFHEVEKNFHLRKKISKSEPENVSGIGLQISSDLNTDLLQTTTELVAVENDVCVENQGHTFVPVQECLSSTCKDEASKADQFSAGARAEIFDELEGMGIQINSRLESLIRSAAIEVLRDALAVVKSRMSQERVNNPAGMLAAAISQKWRPEQSQPATNAPSGFREWFEKARDKRIAIAGSLINGIQSVLTEEGWKPYSEMRRLYPLAD